MWDVLTLAAVAVAFAGVLLLASWLIQRTYHHRRRYGGNGTTS